MLCYKNLMVKNILMHFREDVRYNRITLLSIAKLDQEKPITFVDDRFFHITTQEKKNPHYTLCKNHEVCQARDAT